MRFQRRKSVTIASGAALSDSFEPVDMVFAMIQLGTMTGTTLTPLIQADPTQPFVNVKQSDGVTDVVMTIESDSCVRIPDECFPCCAMKLQSGSNEGAARTIYILGST